MKYVCELCGMIYDEDVGDIRHNIPAGTKFQDLPEDYECPGCYSERQAFSPHKFVRTSRVSSPVAMPSMACSDAKDISDK